MRKQIIAAILTAVMLVASACGSAGTSDAGESVQNSEGGTSESAKETVDNKGNADFEYVGIWKYDTHPLYIDIGESRWQVYTVYGDATNQGDVIAEGDRITLKDDDTNYEPFWLKSSGDGKLVDGDGDSLSGVDKMLFMPTVDDPMANSINFPGDKFGGVTIRFPEEMVATPRTDIAHALNFNHSIQGLLEDDLYSTIMIRFQPITDYDEYLQKGPELAKYAMSYMLDNMIEKFYGDYLIKSLGSSFEDKGTYYSIKGYMWFNGTVFKQDIDKEMCGVMELRYYGPSGYVLMAVSVMPENRQGTVSYFASKIMDTCSYTTGWSTAPKPVPKVAGAKRSTSKPKKKPAGSDPGDYGDDYYWTDSDGDIWYWNGVENIFVSFGSDGYIDDDGEYYESNDAGWDYADNYVDDYYEEDVEYYSDPGDTYDYSDPGDTYDYSDPGDTYDYDYSDYDW